MGQRIGAFDFGAFEAPRRTSPYPLSDWMDGSIWRIWRGEDFQGPLRHMQGRLHYYARSRGGWVQTRSVFEDERQGLVFQFTPPDEGDGAVAAARAPGHPG